MILGQLAGSHHPFLLISYICREVVSEKSHISQFENPPVYRTMLAVDDGRKCRQALQRPQGRDMHKCFILTPSFHFINPLFSPVSSRKTGSPKFPLSPERTNPHVVTPKSKSADTSSAPTTSSLPSHMSLVQSADPTRRESINGAAVQNESLFRSPHPRPTWPHFESPNHKFIAAKISNHDILNEYPNDQSLNLKEVAKDVGVQRRRMDDLTSVLEGVGIIEKRAAQNAVRCAGALSVPSICSRKKRKNSDNISSSSDSDEIGGPPKVLKALSVSSSPYYDTIFQEIGDLKDEERQLDRFIRHLKCKSDAAVQSGRSQDLIAASGNKSQSQVTHSQALVPSSVANPSKQHLLYLTYDDILASVTDCTNNTILGIRAPPGTSLEIPDPDRGEMPGVRRFEVCLSSRPTFVSKYNNEQPQKSDKINVHLIRPSDRQNKKQKVPSSKVPACFHAG